MVKRVALASRLDTAAAKELRNAVAGAEDEGIVFDGSAVEMLGALCLETLLSVTVVWTKAGQSVSFENLSQQMIEDLGRFGLTNDTLLEYAA